MAGRRGRPPKQEAERKAVTVGCRMTVDLRDRLEAAGREAVPPRSASQEAEVRLRASFTELGRAEELFGGPTNFWLFRTIARRIGALEQLTKQRWFEDQYTFDETASLILTALSYFRPRRKGVTAKRLFGGRPPPALGKQLGVRALADVEASAPGKAPKARAAGDPVGPWPHAHEWFRAAGPLVRKMKRSATRDFLAQYRIRRTGK